MTTHPTLNLRVAEMRRDWLDEHYPQACYLARQWGKFTSDNLRKAIPPPPHGNWIGSLVARMVCEGVAVEIGRVKSTGLLANGRKINLYEAVKSTTN